MPWKRICKLPLDPKKKPSHWSGGPVNKLEAKDTGGLVRAFMTKHWKKYTTVLEQQPPPVLDVSHDPVKQLFRLLITPADKATKESRKLISGLDAKVRKVILDSTGAERLDVVDDGMVADEDAPDPVGAREDAPNPVGAQQAKKALYEKLLAAIEPKVGELGRKNPTRLEAWQKALQTAKGQAATGDYDGGKAGLQQLLGALVAVGAAVADQIPKHGREERSKFKRLEEKQLADLNKLDAAIAAKARVNYLVAAEADNVLFRVETQDAPRPLPQFQPFKADLVMDQVKKPVDVARFVQLGFDREEKLLNEAILGGTKTQILNDAQTKANRLVLGIRKESLVDLVAKTPAQRQAEVVKAMGLLKGKYDGAGYDDLSADKQQLVDHICAGLEEGVVAARHEAVQHCQAQAEIAMAVQFASLYAGSDQLFDLNLKSEADLKADAAVALGVVDAAVVGAQKTAAKAKGDPGVQLEWFAKLSPDQQALVGASAAGMAKAINENTPDRFHPADKSMQLGDQEFEFDKELGQGGVGKVSRLKKKGTNEGVVVKSLHFASKRLEMEHELRVHRMVMGKGGHPNITPFKGVVRGPDGSLHMIMEEAKGGDLKQMATGLGIATASGALPNEAKRVLARQFIRDAVAGLKAAQAHNVTHHDIKAQNFLLGEDGTVMIADFGSGQLGQDERGTVPALGAEGVAFPFTPGLEAPELLKEKTATGKADTYTLGLMIHDLMGGDPKQPVKVQHPEKLERGGFGPSALGALDKLTNAMLDPDPDKRPTVDNLEHCSFLLDADADDPVKVAALKAAAVKYSQATVKLLSTKTSSAWLIANNLPDIAKLRDMKLQTVIEGNVNKLDPKVQEACNAVINQMLLADPEVQQAQQQLEAASASFNQVSDPLPMLAMRLTTVVTKMLPVQRLVEGTPVHLKISARLQACQAALDKKDIGACTSKLCALEDHLAEWAGNKKLGHAFRGRARLKKAMAAAPPANPQGGLPSPAEDKLADYESLIFEIMMGTLN